MNKLQTRLLLFFWFTKLYGNKDLSSWTFYIQLQIQITNFSFKDIFNNMIYCKNKHWGNELHTWVIPENTALSTLRSWKFSFWHTPSDQAAQQWCAVVWPVKKTWCLYECYVVICHFKGIYKALYHLLRAWSLLTI